MRDKLLTNKARLIYLIILLTIIGSKAYTQTRKQVYNEIVRQGIECPKVVLAQAIKETGWFKCTECSLDHNNLFGLRYKKKYLEFDTWQESITRYKKFQDKRYDGTKDYLDFLDCIWIHSNGDCARYATDKNYTKDLRTILKQL